MAAAGVECVDDGRGRQAGRPTDPRVVGWLPCLERNDSCLIVPARIQHYFVRSSCMPSQ